MSDVPKAYLAAPFFNEAQRAGVSELEKLIEGAGYDLFSPVRDGMFIKPDATDKERQSVFDLDIGMIKDMDIVVAWIDWLNPPGTQVRVCQDAQNQLQVPFPPPIMRVINAGVSALGQAAFNQNQGLILPNQAPEATSAPKGMAIALSEGLCLTRFKSPPLNLADNGTVFEMGAAFASNIPIFSVSLVGGKFNLMLSQSVLCHSDSLDDLGDHLKKFVAVANSQDTKEYARVAAELKISGKHEFRGGGAEDMQV